MAEQGVGPKEIEHAWEAPFGAHRQFVKFTTRAAGHQIAFVEIHVRGPSRDGLVAGPEAKMQMSIADFKKLVIDTMKDVR